ncbi:MAG TPA: hypothetical protein VKT77_21115, partial [Chthonomonadaceae bacterium]|nr:hypothetical protein [Chthonomonadaceae bacterium]
MPQEVDLSGWTSARPEHGSPLWAAYRSRREFLLVSVSALSAALAAGCGGGGGGAGAGAGASTGPFTVTPSRAAPGSIVTLTGFQAGTGAAPSVMFGAMPAIIHQQGPSGLQVLVPAFLNAGVTAVATPAAPVAVTVQSGTATHAATNAFTVLDLPPAPGTTMALVADMAGMASLFQDFFQLGVFPAFADTDGGTASPLDRAA